MIISRTPFRISLFGGGTDYPTWYKKNKGCVISASINKYCYITLKELPPFFDYKYRLRYFKREEVNSINSIKHPSIRECLHYLKIEKNIDLVHYADLPAQSGMGSSSTFTVGLLHALYTLSYKMPTKYQLAIDAITIEQDIINEAVGSQDQTNAAFGGFNKIDFGGVRKIVVSPIIIEPVKLKLLEDNLIIFFTGISRSAHEVAQHQIKSIEKNQCENELSTIYDICCRANDILMSHNSDIDELGHLLNEQLTNLITNNKIDQIYEKGLKAGAIGGKLLGAGGGGFMLFYVPKNNRDSVLAALKDLLHIPFNFDFLGSQIIYHGYDE